MFVTYFKVAGLIVELHTRSQYMQGYCKDFIVEPCVADIVIELNDEILSKEQKYDPECTIDRISLCERTASFRFLNDNIYKYNAFVFHAAAFSADERGIALCAKSGTGKTTHLNLWMDLLGNRMKIINGDKPIVRIKDETPYIYGAPWSGKERLHSNAFAPLTDICFIERSPTNEVVKLEGPEIAQRLSSQMAQSQNPAVIFKNMEFIENLKKQCNFYIIRCNMEIEAAQVAYKAIFGKEYTDG